MSRRCSGETMALTVSCVRWEITKTYSTTLAINVTHLSTGNNHAFHTLICYSWKCAIKIGKMHHQNLMVLPKYFVSPQNPVCSYSMFRMSLPSVLCIGFSWNVVTARPFTCMLQQLNTFRPRQNGRNFPDDIYKCIFMNENVRVSLKISLKFVPMSQINNIPSLVQIMVWRRPGA